MAGRWGLGTERKSGEEGTMTPPPYFPLLHPRPDTLHLEAALRTIRDSERPQPGDPGRSLRLSGEGKARVKTT
ncbi:hypothetical protein MASR2M79_24100 [Aminivibrio sp.]